MIYIFQSNTDVTKLRKDSIESFCRTHVVRNGYNYHEYRLTTKSGDKFEYMLPIGSPLSLKSQLDLALEDFSK